MRKAAAAAAAAGLNARWWKSNEDGGSVPAQRRSMAMAMEMVGITAYSTHTAQVTLKHNYPRGNGHVEALVDVNLLLQTLNSEQTDIGQWVNVIGYLTFINPAVPLAAIDPRHPSRSNTVTRVGVQALIFWIARDLDLGTYEKSMLADAHEDTVGPTPTNLVIK
ncbi:CST complex subunit Ten1 [Nemania serpens]|nr:CST complex subunit Ten1 [Nemania serpens]